MKMRAVKGSVQPSKGCPMKTPGYDRQGVVFGWSEMAAEIKKKRKRAMKKTKIICTMEFWWTPVIPVRDVMLAGMDVARLNFFSWKP